MINVIVLISLFCANVGDDSCIDEMKYCVEKSKVSFEVCMEEYYD